MAAPRNSPRPQFSSSRRGRPRGHDAVIDNWRAWYQAVGKYHGRPYENTQAAPGFHATAAARYLATTAAARFADTVAAYFAATAALLRTCTVEVTRRPDGCTTISVTHDGLTAGERHTLCEFVAVHRALGDPAKLLRKGRVGGVLKPLTARDMRLIENVHAAIDALAPRRRPWRAPKKESLRRVLVRKGVVSARTTPRAFNKRLAALGFSRLYPG